MLNIIFSNIKNKKLIFIFLELKYQINFIKLNYIYFNMKNTDTSTNTTADNTIEQINEQNSSGENNLPPKYTDLMNFVKTATPAEIEELIKYMVFNNIDPNINKE